MPAPTQPSTLAAAAFLLGPVVLLGVSCEAPTRGPLGPPELRLFDDTLPAHVVDGARPPQPRADAGSMDMEPELQLQSCLWLLHELRAAGERLHRLQPSALSAQSRWLQNADALRSLTLAWHDELERSIPEAPPSSAPAEATATGGAATARPAPSQRDLLDRTMRHIRRELRERDATPEQLAELRETLRHLEKVAGRIDDTSASTQRPVGSLLQRGRRSLVEQARLALDRLDRQATALDRLRLRIHAIEETSVHAAAPAWNTARAALASKDGIMLEPRFGLVPLGRNRSTGLYEFWHVASGERPPFSPETGGGVSTESGIVLVLIPGGPASIGATDGAGNEQPVHRIELEPYWIAKHEMTQGQWQRCFGAVPSTYSEGAKPFGQHTAVDARHPVESIDWNQARQLTRVGLELPTEAQWEHAARAGSTTAGRANLRSRDGRDDGYAIHAPVGSFAPNAFGLHEVRGNVAEWCADTFGSYRLPALPGDGARALPSSEWRPVRGGSFDDGPFAARSTARQRQRTGYRHATIGVRPALRVR